MTACTLDCAAPAHGGPRELVSFNFGRQTRYTSSFRASGPVVGGVCRIGIPQRRCAGIVQGSGPPPRLPRDGGRREESAAATAQAVRARARARSALKSTRPPACFVPFPFFSVEEGDRVQDAQGACDVCVCQQRAICGGRRAASHTQAVPSSPQMLLKLPSRREKKAIDAC